MKTNKFIEIRDNNDLDKAIEFAWNVTKREKKVGYPEKIWEYDCLREVFLKSFNHKDDKILLLKSEEGIEGVVCLFVDLEEKYLQTMGGIYYKDDFEHTIDRFIEYLREYYKHFEIIIGYTSMDKSILKVLERKGQVLDQSEFFKLHRNNLNPKENREDIKLLTMEHFESFAKIHDKMNPEMFWNSERLRKNFNKWRIFTFYKEEKIGGYVLSMIYDNSIGEIFTITTTMNIDDDILESLVYMACKDMFNMGSTGIISSCDIGSFERELYNNLGFESTNDYISYSIKI